MKQLKVSKLSINDRIKYQNIGKKRQKQIEKSPSSKLYAPTTLNDLARTIHPGKIEVIISSIEELNKDMVNIYLKSKDYLPPYKGGDIITIYRSNDSKAYYLSGNPSIKQYRITVSKEDELLSSCRPNEHMFISEPIRDFSYNKIRDKKEIIVISSNTYIASTISVLYDALPYVTSATLLYTAKSKSLFLFTKELEELEKKYPYFKIEYYLSPTKKITASDLEKLNIKDKTIFISGEAPFYQYLNTLLNNIGITKNNVRYQRTENIPSKLGKEIYKMTIFYHGEKKKINALASETILSSMKKAGIKAKNKCNIGICGYCKSKLIKGKIKTNQDNLRYAEKHANYFHPCITYPLSDIVISLND